MVSIIPEGKRLCACGCGAIIPKINKMRKLSTYKYGHNNRGRTYAEGVYKLGPKARNWRGGRYVTESGYVMIYHPGHPRSHHAYVREHIVIMEQHIGRSIGRNETIHHKDGNRQNNKIENLVLMASKTHSKITTGYLVRDHFGRFVASAYRNTRPVYKHRTGLVFVIDSSQVCP